jgi:hypothetical protein
VALAHFAVSTRRNELRELYEEQQKRLQKREPYYPGVNASTSSTARRDQYAT